MRLRETFPWSFALWQLIVYRPVGIFLISATILMLVTMACFRIESLLFQRRVNSVLSRLAQVRLDHSPEQELRELVPELHPLKSKPRRQDDLTPQTEEPLEYVLADGNVENGLLPKLLWKLGTHVNSVLRLLYLCGQRFHTFHASVAFREGKAVRIKYDLWLDNGENHNLYAGVGIDVTALCRAGWTRRDELFAPTYDDLMPYAGHVASNAPENSLHVAITPEAPAELSQAAFDVHITCLRDFSGCRNTKQILPGVWPPRFPWKSWGSLKPRPAR